MTNPLTTSARVQSLDLLRGLVMVLMAIDHVRVYSGLPPGGPDAGIFFTRWITHFCAPAFAFLAGISAFLYGVKLNNKRKLATYLITRGLLLVILELTVIRFLWAFHISTDFILAGVIWMLGWCMVLLAAFLWMKPYLVLMAGTAIIVLQSVFSKVPLLFSETARASFGKYWEFIYPSGFETFPNTIVLYVIVPWVGVMAAGYGFGSVFLMEEKKRNRLCSIVGASMILAFIVMAAMRASSSTDEMPFVFRLLNQQKYPASLLFLLMTLGPVIALVPMAERAKGWFSRVLVTIGRVPFFYYLAHILVIHISALLVQVMLHGSVHHDWFLHAPYVFLEPEYRWSLPLLYVIFAADVAILYFLCKQYSRYKTAHPEKSWLTYL